MHTCRIHISYMGADPGPERWAGPGAAHSFSTEATSLGPEEIDGYAKVIAWSYRPEMKGFIWSSGVPHCCAPLPRTRNQNLKPYLTLGFP